MTMVRNDIHTATPLDGLADAVIRDDISAVFRDILKLLQE